MPTGEWRGRPSAVLVNVLRDFLTRHRRRCGAL